MLLSHLRKRYADPEWAEFEARYQSGDILEGTVRNCDHRYGVLLTLQEKLQG